MSETSRVRAIADHRRATTQGPRATETRPAGSSATLNTGALLEAALPLLPDWLRAQRWYAGKGRPISTIEPVTVTPLYSGDPALLHLLLEVRHDSGGADIYQLLLGISTAHADLDDAATRISPAAVIGRINHGPYDGTVIFDAAHEPRLTNRLLQHLAGSNRIGPLTFRRTPGPRIQSGLPGRVATAEQSNTSVIYGSALILKLFRRISPGVNPDLELSLALARGGSSRVPKVSAWFEARMPGTEPATLGLLQEFLPQAQDGWELALEHVRRLRGGGVVDNFADEAHRLGRATAEVHLALARALPVAGVEPDLLASDMVQRLDTAVHDVPQLLPYRAALNDTFRKLTELEIPAQRIHGDLHLGQAVRTPSGWVLLDFEGEPAKPLAERRLPQPALRDVAAMLRSFDYAAGHLLTESPDDPELAELATSWAARNREAFCAGYTAGGGLDPDTAPELLRALEIDKAVYEVVYEARHRPNWLPIPLAAIHRLATG